MNLAAQSLTRSGLSPLSTARMLWRGRFLVLAVWIIGTAAAFLVVRRMPSVYAADAVVLVESQRIPERYVASSVNSEVQERLVALKQNVLSPMNLQRLIVEFQLYPVERRSLETNAVYELMRDKVWITQEKNWVGNHSVEVHVGFLDANPDTVYKVANRVTSLFIAGSQKTRQVQAEDTSAFVDGLLGEARKKLEAIEASLSAYKLRHTGELPQQESALMSTIAAQQNEYAAAGAALNQAQQSKETVESTLAIAEATAATIEKNAHQPSSRAIETAQGIQPAGRKKSEILESQMEQLRLRYSDEHPELRRLQAQLDGQKKLEAAEDAALPLNPLATAPDHTRPTYAAAPANTREPVEVLQARERVAHLRLQLAAFNKESEKQQTNRDRIFEEMNRTRSRMGMLPVREQEMAQLLRDYDVAHTNYTTLLNKKVAAQTATELETSHEAERFTIISAARRPSTPTKPNRPLLLAAGCGTSLVFGLMLAFAAQMSRGKLLGEWELPPDTVILARLPHVKLTYPAPAAALPGGGR